MQERERILHDLGERVKELTLLHGAARLLQSDQPPSLELFAALASMIPGAWQYPDLCGARIAYGEWEAITPGWYESPWVQQTVFTTGDGRTGTIEVAYQGSPPLVHGDPFLAEEGHLIQSVGEILQSYLERHRVQAALRASETLFRAVFESAALGIALIAPDGTVIRSNPALSQMLGYDESELRRMTPGDFTHPDDLDHDRALHRSLEAGELESYQLEQRYLDRDGQTAWGRLSASLIRDEAGLPAFELEMIENVTAPKRVEAERAELERQLREAQKLEALGLLAGGIAHDFNNLLTAINGFSELLAGELMPGSVAADYAQTIRQAGERAATLTGQLLAFSRHQVLQTQVLDLNAILTDLQPILRMVLRADVELILVLADDLAPVLADSGQLSQVIMNLASNARDAMPDGGKLILETMNVELGAQVGDRHELLEPGPHVLLAVSDTGEGMDAETRSHIFEPFFTTKLVGRGTGLGLATVYGIVKQSGGDIGVYSEPGQGTTFKIYLPPGGAGGITVPQQVRSLEPVGGTETILLTEDDEGVRAFVTQALLAAGYDVYAAATPAAALQLMNELQGTITIHLLLTDMVMPGMTGPELSHAIHQLRPEVVTLFMTGYTPDVFMRQGMLEGSVPYLQKPFSSATLLSRVRATLDQFAA